MHSLNIQLYIMRCQLTLDTSHFYRCKIISRLFHKLCFKPVGRADKQYICIGKYFLQLIRYGKRRVYMSARTACGKCNIHILFPFTSSKSGVCVFGYTEQYSYLSQLCQQCASAVAEERERNIGIRYRIAGNRYIKDSLQTYLQSNSECHQRAELILCPCRNENPLTSKSTNRRITVIPPKNPSSSHIIEKTKSFWLSGR